MPDDEAICSCGHTWDEHDVTNYPSTPPCDVYGCDCMAFEEDPDA